MADVRIIQRGTLQEIADAIRVKSGTSDPILVSDMPNKIIEIPSDGINYLNYLTKFNLYSLNIFNKSKVELNFPNCVSFDSSFIVNSTVSAPERKNNTVEELIIHCPNTITSMQYSFGESNYHAEKVLKKLTLDFNTNGKLWNYAFNNRQGLEVIDGTPIDISNMTSEPVSIFGACYALKEVRFQGIISVKLDIKYSPLSKASILNIVGCLSDDVASQTLLLNKAAVNKAFETSEGANDGSESQEWSNLINTKQNWTFSLVVI